MIIGISGEWELKLDPYSLTTISVFFPTMPHRPTETGQIADEKGLDWTIAYLLPSLYQLEEYTHASNPRPVTCMGA